MARTIGWVEDAKKPEQVKETVSVEKAEEPAKKTVRKTTKK